DPSDWRGGPLHDRQCCAEDAPGDRSTPRPQMARGPRRAPFGAALSQHRPRDPPPPGPPPGSAARPGGHPRGPPAGPPPARAGGRGGGRGTVGEQWRPHGGRQGLRPRPRAGRGGQDRALGGLRGAAVPRQPRAEAGLLTIPSVSELPSDGWPAAPPLSRSPATPPRAGQASGRRAGPDRAGARARVRGSQPFHECLPARVWLPTFGAAPGQGGSVTTEDAPLVWSRVRTTRRLAITGGGE